MMKYEYYNEIIKKYNLSGKNVFLIGTPNHGNLGDHAIAYATSTLLTDVFPDRQLIEISMDNFILDIDGIYHAINKDDIIILQGGGNLGNYYMEDEMIRRYVISRFRKNKIILFPQSVWFSEDESGEKEMLISSTIYARNKNLYLIARDCISEMFLKQHFSNEVFLLPDIVFTLSQINLQKERRGALLCLRNDMEGVLNEDDKLRIQNIIKRKYNEVQYTDTVVDYKEINFNRDLELKKKLGEISGAEIVITDRLHGMIFSVIMGTPCIALPVINTKISGMMNQIDDSNNVICINNLEELEEKLQKFERKYNQYYGDKISMQYRRVLGEILERDIVYNDDEETKISDEIFEIVEFWGKQHYETMYLKEKITSEYNSLSNNYDERISELQIYKEWVDKLKEQNEQLINEKDNLLQDLIEKNSYKEWADKLKEQNEQLINEKNNLLQDLIEKNSYKEWAEKLREQNEQLINEKSNLLQDLNDKHRQWGIRQRELYKLINDKDNIIREMEKNRGKKI